MLWPRLTEAGALTSMLFGLLLGIIRLSLDVAYPQPHCGKEDTRNAFVKLHFMYYGKKIRHLHISSSNPVLKTLHRQSHFFVFS